VSNKIITTVRDATETEKGVSILQPGAGDIKGICLNPNLFYFQNGKADPICIGADENGLINFEAGDNVTLEAIEHGLRISAKTGGGGDKPNYIVIKDGESISREAQNNTIYIIQNTFGKAQFYMPETAKIGWWFGVMGITWGFLIRTGNDNQAIFYNGKEYTGTGQSISTEEDWWDAKITCYEANTKFKLRFFKS
jgi:hypothetical protein